jgi:hypothetical protein
MAQNWGANWHSLAYLTGQMLSIRLTDTDGQTIEFTKDGSLAKHLHPSYSSSETELRAGFPVHSYTLNAIMIDIPTPKN